MDSIEIIYYNLEDEREESLSRSGLQKFVHFRKGGKFVDFRLNSKSLKEIIEENVRQDYFHSWIFNLGATIFFDNLDFVFTKIQLIRLLGNKVEEKDILEIFNCYNNFKYSINDIREIAKEENQEKVYLTVCRLCGDYECGVGGIFVKKEKNKIIWDFNSFYGVIEDEEFQYKYEFDAIEYIYELYEFERYYKQLLEEKDQTT